MEIVSGLINCYTFSISAFVPLQTMNNNPSIGRSMILTNVILIFCYIGFSFSSIKRTIIPLIAALGYRPPKRPPIEFFEESEHGMELANSSVPPEKKDDTQPVGKSKIDPDRSRRDYLESPFLTVGEPPTEKRPKRILVGEDIVAPRIESIIIT